MLVVLVLAAIGALGLLAPDGAGPLDALRLLDAEWLPPLSRGSEPAEPAGGRPDPAVPTRALPWASRAAEAAVGLTSLERFYDLMLPGVELARGVRTAGPGLAPGETFSVAWRFPDGSWVSAGFSPGRGGLVLRRVAADPVTSGQRR